jgi:hypothetical protein
MHLHQLKVRSRQRLCSYDFNYQPSDQVTAPLTPMSPLQPSSEALSIFANWTPGA